MSEISRVGSNGELTFSKSGVQLIRLGQEALLQVPCLERDHAGRLAPIVCWMVEDDTNKNAAATLHEIEAFAHSIGRSINAEQQQLAQEALTILAKKPIAPRQQILRLLRIPLMSLSYLTKLLRKSISNLAKFKN